MGFYYDDQMNNDDYTIRLYGNGPDYDTLIAKSVFSENFEFEIGNTWTNFEAGNAIENLWNSIKPLAAYADIPMDAFRRMREQGAFKGGRTNVTRGINDWMEKNTGPDGVLSNFQDYLNKALVVQGTRFIYFGGTNVDMGNLMMKYTIMYDPVSDFGMGKTVQEQIEAILPYAMGKFEAMGDEGVMSLIGWQDPPGEFTADYKNVDQQLKGSLKLKFGNMFEIDNLVIKSLSVSMSRVKVKTDMSQNSNTPLYADITITFQLGGFITRNKLLKYIRPTGY